MDPSWGMEWDDEMFWCTKCTPYRHLQKPSPTSVWTKEQADVERLDHWRAVAWESSMFTRNVWGRWFNLTIDSYRYRISLKSILEKMIPFDSYSFYKKIGWKPPTRAFGQILCHSICEGCNLFAIINNEGLTRAGRYRFRLRDRRCFQDVYTYDSVYLIIENNDNDDIWWFLTITKNIKEQTHRKASQMSFAKLWTTAKIM